MRPDPRSRNSRADRRVESGKQDRDKLLLHRAEICNAIQPRLVPRIRQNTRFLRKQEGPSLANLRTRQRRIYSSEPTRESESLLPVELRRRRADSCKERLCLYSFDGKTIWDYN